MSNNNIKKGIAWNSLSIVMNILNLFVITAVLARILSPSAFGYLAIILVFLNFAKIFVDAGFTAAIVQSKNLNDTKIQTINLINMSLGLFLTLMTFIFADKLSIILGGDELLSNLIKLASIALFIQSFGMVERGILQRNMYFKSLTLINIVAEIFKGALSIILALNGFGAFSLVLGTLSFITIEAISLIIICRVNFGNRKWKFSLNEIKYELKYGLYLFGFQIIHYLTQNVDKILISRIFNSYNLGLYQIVFQLIMIPRQNINPVITKVMFPAFSVVQDDPKQVRYYYINLMKFVSFVTSILLLGLMVLAPEFINIVYGEKWIEAVPVLQIMCLLGILRSLISIQGNLLMSLGKTKFMFLNNLLIDTFTIISLILFTQKGLEVVAIVQTFFALIMLFSTSIYITKVQKITFKDFLYSIKNSLFCSFSLVVLIMLIKINTNLNDLITLLFSILTASAFIIIYLFITEKQLFKKLIREII